MEDRTVILTTLNEARAAPNSVIDLFLQSFRIGDCTRRLLNPSRFFDVFEMQIM